MLSVVLESDSPGGKLYRRGKQKHCIIFYIVGLPYWADMKRHATVVEKCGTAITVVGTAIALNARAQNRPCGQNNLNKQPFRSGIITLFLPSRIVSTKYVYGTVACSITYCSVPYGLRYTASDIRIMALKAVPLPCCIHGGKIFGRTRMSIVWSLL